MKNERQDKERDLGTRIGVAVRRYREQGGMTQADLAEKTGVGQSEISLIERGKHSKLSTLDRVATALGLRLSGMLHFAEDIGSTKTVVKEARAFVRATRAQRGKKPTPSRRRSAATG